MKNKQTTLDEFEEESSDESEIDADIAEIYSDEEE